jgi:two-component system, OmpR family, response regulator CpxR
MVQQVRKQVANAAKPDIEAENPPEFQRILLVDDDVELCELIAEYLVHEGLEVTPAHNGRDGLNLALSGDFSLVVLDVMLPRVKGFDVLRLIRKESNVPVIMLTARGDDVDRILGLEIGADDYLPKPVNPRELTARIHAVLRRVPPSVKETSAKVGKRVAVGDIELDLGSRSVWRRDQEIELTSVEFDLLNTLLSVAGRTVTREKLVKAALRRELVPFDRSIDVHLSNLRRKLGPGPDGGERIKTIRGVGYIYAISAKQRVRAS